MTNINALDTFEQTLESALGRSEKLSREVASEVENFLLDICVGLSEEESQTETVTSVLQSFFEGSDELLTRFMNYYDACSKKDKGIIIQSILHDSDDMDLPAPMVNFMLLTMKEVGESIIKTLDTSEGKIVSEDDGGVQTKGESVILH